MIYLQTRKVVCMQVRIIEESVISHDITLVGNTIKTELANVEMVLTA